MILVLVLLFAVRGLFRGTLGQIFGLVGLVAALWTASWLARWVAGHWEGARPAGVFWALGWLVALLAGVAVLSLFEWLGERVREAVDSTPARWLDRMGGFLVGATTGLLVAALVTTLVVLPEWPLHSPGRAGTSGGSPGRLAMPTLAGAARACQIARGYFPGSEWLERRLEAARRRVELRAQPSGFLLHP